MHKRTSWPMHGRYYCLDCGREHRVPWMESTNHRPTAAPLHRPADWAFAVRIRGAVDAMKQIFRSAIT